MIAEIAKCAVVLTKSTANCAVAMADLRIKHYAIVAQGRFEGAKECAKYRHEYYKAHRTYKNSLKKYNKLMSNVAE